MAPSRGGGEDAMDSSSPEASSSSSSSGRMQEVEEVEEWTWKRPALVVAKLWCVGFWDACCLNRAYYCCRRSKRVLKKTGQCFMLNVVAFLGSIFSLQKGVSPFVRWLLSAPLDSSALTSNGLLANFIVFLLYLCWLCPLYFASFVLNCLWYNEIAAHGFVALKKQASESSGEPSKEEKGSSGGRSKSNSAIESLVMRIGEQIYSVIMLTFFFLEVWLLSYIPYVGQLLKFVLMSWLYAYYCFDYKWGLCRWSLEKRLLFFESNWAFFAGFGSPCVLATFFLSPLVGGGVMAVVFPIFVLVATASDPEAATNYCLNGKQSGLPRLHLFYVANKITVPTVRFLQTYWSTSGTRKKTQ